MRAVVLRGVERRPVVQVVNRGDRPRRVRVSVHGSRHPYSVHPAVMGQLIVLSDPARGGGAGGEGEPSGSRKRSREKRSGKGMGRWGGVGRRKRKGKRGQAGRRDRGREK